MSKKVMIWVRLIYIIVKRLLRSNFRRSACPNSFWIKRYIDSKNVSRSVTLSRCHACVTLVVRVDSMLLRWLLLSVCLRAPNSASLLHLDGLGWLWCSFKISPHILRGDFCFETLKYFYGIVIQARCENLDHQFRFFSSKSFRTLLFDVTSVSKLCVSRNLHGVKVALLLTWAFPAKNLQR